MQKMLFAACVLFAPAAFAADFNYVAPGAIPPEFIVPPPAVGSVLYNNEIQEIIKNQAAATLPDIAAAKEEEHLRPELMDKAITRSDHPKTYNLLDKVKSDCTSISDVSKNFWNYTRPNLADNHIKPLIIAPNNASYPSGHTACSRVMAEVLGELSPKNRPQFRARAADIAQHRVIGGVHWPHDLAGGEQLALILFGALQMSDNFQRDLADAKTEWK